MYLFNPLYLFSNVIYIIPERRRIMIERHCWNTTVRKIFRGRNVDGKLLVRFKQLLYDSYVAYMDTGTVDYRNFNQVLSEIQEARAPPSFLESVIEANETEIELNENTYVEEENFLNDQELVLTPALDNILEIGQHVADTRRRAVEWLNLFMVHSPKHQSLIDMIGFNRILSVINQILVDGKFYFNSDLLKELFIGFPELPYLALRFRGNVWFICEFCNRLNSHRTFYGDVISSNRQDPHTPCDVKVYYRSEPLAEKRYRLPITVNDRSFVYDGRIAEHLEVSVRGQVWFGDTLVNDLQVVEDQLVAFKIRDLLKEETDYYQEKILPYIRIHCNNNHFCETCTLNVGSSNFYVSFYDFYKRHNISLELFKHVYQISSETSYFYYYPEFEKETRGFGFYNTILYNRAQNLPLFENPLVPEPSNVVTKSDFTRFMKQEEE